MKPNSTQTKIKSLWIQNERENNNIQKIQIKYQSFNLKPQTFRQFQQEGKIGRTTFQIIVQAMRNKRRNDTITAEPPHHTLQSFENTGKIHDTIDARVQKFVSKKHREKKEL